MQLRAKLAIRNEIAVSARERLGLSQIALAKAVGVPHSHVCAVECLRFAEVSDATIAKLADFFCIDRTALVPAALRRNAEKFDQQTVRDVPEAALLGWKDTRVPLLDNPVETTAEAIDRTLVANLVREAMDRLTSREQMVLRMRYGIDGGGERTLDDVGRAVGVTRERVRMIEDAAIRKLRRPSPQARRLLNCVSADPVGDRWVCRACNRSRDIHDPIRESDCEACEKLRRYELQIQQLAASDAAFGRRRSPDTDEQVAAAWQSLDRARSEAVARRTSVKARGSYTTTQELRGS